MSLSQSDCLRRNTMETSSLKLPSLPENIRYQKSRTCRSLRHLQRQSSFANSLNTQRLPTPQSFLTKSPSANCLDTTPHTRTRGSKCKFNSVIESPKKETTSNCSPFRFFNFSIPKSFDFNHRQASTHNDSGSSSEHAPLSKRRRISASFRNLHDSLKKSLTTPKKYKLSSRLKIGRRPQNISTLRSSMRCSEPKDCTFVNTCHKIVMNLVSRTSRPTTPQHSGLNMRSTGMYMPQASAKESKVKDAASGPTAQAKTAHSRVNTNNHAHTQSPTQSLNMSGNEASAHEDELPPPPVRMRTSKNRKPYLQKAASFIFSDREKGGSGDSLTPQFNRKANKSLRAVASSPLMPVAMHNEYPMQMLPPQSYHITPPQPPQGPLPPPPPPHGQTSGKSVKKSDSLLRDKVEESFGACIGLGASHQEYSTAYYASAMLPLTTNQQNQLGQRNARDRTSYAHGEKSESKKDEITPSGTPTQSRKNRRRSNLFNSKSKDEEKKTPNGGIGSGRAIPVKQDTLYKKSKNSLNREWKKKYVTLTEDGKLTYHPNMHDYMEDQHGKHIDLSRTTVKIPGQPRPTSNGLLKNQVNGSSASACESEKKKKHRRARSGARGLNESHEEADSYEFMIVSLDNRSWHFEAASLEERDVWVHCIENCIMKSLQGVQSPQSVTSGPQVASIRSLFGNSECADCGKPNPEWASLNLGSLVCIECSGIHRQLGTHHSRVRSLTLDDWPSNHISVMCAVGNKLANSVWEAKVGLQTTYRKPGPDSPREEKEAFIQAKYERREFLPDLPFKDSPVQQQLIDAIARYDTRQVILCLAVAGPAVNERYSKQDPRAAIHIAATLGQIVYLQLLLWYSADINVTDHEGRNAYFYASAANQPECADFLRLLGCQVAQPGHTANAATLPRRRSKTTGQPTAEIGL